MKLEKLEKQLENIYNKITAAEKGSNGVAKEVHQQYKASAKNLYRYLLLRSNDLRTIQNGLSEHGISSLGSGAGYVYHNVSSALRLVKLLLGKSWQPHNDVQTIGFSKSKKLLRKHANLLFNSENKVHATGIMVTMPDEAAHDTELLKRLMAAGMGIARINLSHGDQTQWIKILGNIEAVSKEMQLPIKIYMDLPGPKIRTSTILKRNKKIPSAGPKQVEFIKIAKNDHLILRKEGVGNDPQVRVNNQENEHPVVHASLPQIIDDLQIGQPVFFDDGTIEAQVLEKYLNEVLLVIINAYKSKLASGKGINLPQTHLNLPSLTDEDIDLLPFVSKHADLVGYSFVRNAFDVTKLYKVLQILDQGRIGVIFKIENVEAFENLPSILIQGMARAKIGVMIARGDLAVEVGFERISEVQNQILLLCEAAHVPVIWATQVLDTLAKKGIATRAEISDVAISAQAECVMLNKGPYIVEAVSTLKNILQRMEAHSQKKKNTMRALKVAKKNVHYLKTMHWPVNRIT